MNSLISTRNPHCESQKYYSSGSTLENNQEKVNSFYEIQKNNDTDKKNDFCFDANIISDVTINLVSDKNTLLWEIVKNDQTLKINFSNTTTSSLCHPKTKELVHNIKKNSAEPSVLKDFKITRIYEKNTEYNKINKLAEEINSDFPDLKNSDPAKKLNLIYYISKKILKSVQHSKSTFSFDNAIKDIFEKYKEALNLEKQMKFLSSIEDFYIFEIEPCSYPSIIDDRLRISKFTWAVTLTTGPSGVANSHASILIEGVANDRIKELPNNSLYNENDYFLYRIEFSPEIEMTFCDHEKYTDHVNKNKIKRTKVWMRSSEQILAMIGKINIEYQQQLKGEYNLQDHFSILGRESISGKGKDSCLTWSREHFKLLDIELETSIIDKLVAIPIKYTSQPKVFLNKKVKTKI